MYNALHNVPTVPPFICVSKGAHFPRVPRDRLGQTLFSSRRDCPPAGVEKAHASLPDARCFQENWTADHRSCCQW